MNMSNKTHSIFFSHKIPIGIRNNNFNRHFGPSHSLVNNNKRNKSEAEINHNHNNKVSSESIAIPNLVPEKFYLVPRDNYSKIIRLNTKIKKSINLSLSKNMNKNINLTNTNYFPNRYNYSILMGNNIGAVSSSLPKIASVPISLERTKQKQKGKIKNLKSFSSQKNINFVENKVISMDEVLKENYPSYQYAKHSENSFLPIVSYGVNTYKGMVRNYNEDRVTILINLKDIKNPKTIGKWPKICYFSIYDGHSGNKCCEYLKTNLHNYIFRTKEFPSDPIKAIELGFKNCENNFLKSIFNQNMYIDNSGSCALIILTIDEMCYVVNLGDSRALYSYNSGEYFFQLSRDQKPIDPIEKKRIYRAGGSIFKTSPSHYGINPGEKGNQNDFNLPYRILPGRLSVR